MDETERRHHWSLIRLDAYWWARCNPRSIRLETIRRLLVVDHQRWRVHLWEDLQHLCHLSLGFSYMQWGRLWPSGG